MLFQFHAHDPKNTTETVLLMQGEVNSETEATIFHERCMKIWSESPELIPDGWTPLICDENAPQFARSAN